jgi:hypothetical protein
MDVGCTTCHMTIGYGYKHWVLYRCRVPYRHGSWYDYWVSHAYGFMHAMMPYAHIVYPPGYSVYMHGVCIQGRTIGIIMSGAMSGQRVFSMGKTYMYLVCVQERSKGICVVWHDRLAHNSLSNARPRWDGVAWHAHCAGIRGMKCRNQGSEASISS